jgi:hypothetical protein
VLGSVPVPETAKGFQIHVAFDPPLQNNITAHQQIAALYQLLNDYAYAKKARGVRGNGMGRFVGPNTRPIGNLADSLINRVPLEQEDVEYANVGVHKYNYVGLRTNIYGGLKIGFEIRGGWEKNWLNFRRLIEKIATTLQQIDSYIQIKNNRIDGASNFTLLHHYNFHQTGAPNISPTLLNSLRHEATHLATILPINSQPFGATDPETVEETLRRWIIPFMPWEYHPSIGRSGASLRIVQARQNLADKLNQHFNTPPDQRGGKVNFVTLASQQFFNDTQLFRLL